MVHLNSSGGGESIDEEIERALDAVEGYLYLGLPQEALGQLAGLDAAAQKESSVMRAEVRVLLHMHEWSEAERLSDFGRAIFPFEDEFVVQHAFALHRQQRENEAIDALLSAPDWIRRTGILHYNLACYEARLGDLNTAQRCIATAIKINAAFKKDARKDPDLQRLWN